MDGGSAVDVACGTDFLASALKQALGSFAALLSAPAALALASEVDFGSTGLAAASLALCALSAGCAVTLISVVAAGWLVPGREAGVAVVVAGAGAETEVEAVVGAALAVVEAVADDVDAWAEEDVGAVGSVGRVAGMGPLAGGLDGDVFAD